MPLAKSHAISLLGLNGSIIEVEADISSNLPGFVIVGLPDASLNEATARVRAATVNSGLALPNRKLTVNLSPAAIPKYGSSFDLAIAVAALRAANTIKDSSAIVFIGELGLDGSLRPVRGVLPQVMAAKQFGFESVMVPTANAAEAALVDGVDVIAVASLRQAAARLGVAIDLSEVDVEVQYSSPAAVEENVPDIADVFGQQEAVEALLAAAAGGHHLLLIGSPGVGKTMLAERLPALLPDLTLEQALETTAVHSITKGRNSVGSQLVTRPPFEAPHHTATVSSLIGGGLGVPNPGLVSLAHNGVLFLDEAPEFQQPALEALRQSLESGRVQIARSAGSAVFPARFQLVLAANPCPCGLAMSKTGQCRCTAAARQKYLAKLSGPLLDRVDIRLRVLEANGAQVALDRNRSDRLNTATARQLVQQARDRSLERNQKGGFLLNANLPQSFMRAQLDAKITMVLDQSLKRGQLSMRGYDRCMRLAFTLADLDGSSVTSQHIARAMFMRGEDRLAAA